MWVWVLVDCVQVANVVVAVAAVLLIWGSIGIVIIVAVLHGGEGVGI